MRTGRKTDKGFTLIELIVVIAIIAVLMGVLIISINPIQSTAAKQAAVNTRDAVLKGKQYAMTRGNTGTFMEISQNGKDLEATFYVGSQPVESEVISTRRVTVKYDDGSGKSGYIMTWNNGTATVSSNSLYIGFDKGSGACRKFSDERSSVLDDSNVRTIEISAGGRTYEVTISGLTGNVDMAQK